MDLKGSIPEYIINNMVIPQSMIGVQRVQTYFMQLQASASFDAAGRDEVRASGKECGVHNM